jgi:hypothetical protein
VLLLFPIQARLVFCDAGQMALMLQTAHATVHDSYQSYTHAGWTGVLPASFALAYRQIPIKTQAIEDMLARGMRLLGRCVRPHP